MDDYPRPTSKRSGKRGFSIAEFSAYKDKAGILRTHDFHIEIPWPQALVGNRQIVRDLELVCDNINFPGTGANIAKVQRYSYGAMESRPTFPQFSDLQCTFMTDRETNIWQFFHRWMQLVVNYDFDQFQASHAYEIGYKDEYAVDMFLYIYDPHGTLVRKVGFRQAFPIMVHDIGFNWAKANEMVRVQVQFAFMDWTEVPLQDNATK